METNHRLIDANALLQSIAFAEIDTVMDRLLIAETINASPIVDAVEVELFNALKSLVNGEWVDCKLVQEALGIDFGIGLKMFDFSRTAEWNPAPLNGQKITTKFKLKNAVVHGRWIKRRFTDTLNGYECSICHTTWDADTSYCPYCGADMRERKDNEI